MKDKTGKNWIIYRKKKSFVYGCLNANCILKWSEKGSILYTTMEMDLFGTTPQDECFSTISDKCENFVATKISRSSGCGIRSKTLWVINRGAIIQLKVELHNVHMYNRAATTKRWTVCEMQNIPFYRYMDMKIWFYFTKKNGFLLS